MHIEIKFATKKLIRFIRVVKTPISGISFVIISISFLYQGFGFVVAFLFTLNAILCSYILFARRIGKNLFLVYVIFVAFIFVFFKFSLANAPERFELESAFDLEILGTVENYTSVFDDTKTIYLHSYKICLHDDCTQSDLTFVIFNNSPVGYMYKDELEILGSAKSVDLLQSDSFRKYLVNNDIYFILEAKTIEKLNSSSTLTANLYRLKSSLSKRIENRFPMPNSSLISGVVFGERAAMSEDFKDKLSNTGTTHIVAVSGYNVSLLVTSFMAVAPLLGRKKTCISSIVFLILFISFVGWDNIPVVRAGVGGIVMVISMTTGRKGVFENTYLFVLSLLVLQNSQVINDLSFQLSALSTFGVVKLSKPIEKYICRLPSLVRENLATTLAATFATSPVIMFNFGKIPIIAPLVNVLVLPVISYITIFGLIYCIVLSFSNTLSMLFEPILFVASQYVTGIIMVLGRNSLFITSKIPDMITICSVLPSVRIVTYLVNVFKQWRKRH